MLASGQRSKSDNEGHLRMKNWPISLDSMKSREIFEQKHMFVEIPDLIIAPEDVIEFASLQKFAKITPQYPGVRSELPKTVCSAWLSEFSPMLDSHFDPALHGWEMQAWFSLVTTPPAELIPMQCFPHVDGTDPSQIAMMLYLHRTQHGGTGFFRHKSTGLETITDETFPAYRDALQADVGRTGLPSRAYVSDGEPHFERVHLAAGAFNSAVFYRGNLLHSGLIDNDAPLSADPRKGRLTINAFFRPKGPKG
ncbi:MAG: DUF6445 family protein [Pseudomonadota bacterium]